MEIGITAMRIICLCFITAGMSIIFTTVFQAVGKGFMSLIISVLRQLVLILPLALILSNFGLNFVWAAFPIAELVSFIVAALLMARLNRKVFSKLEEL